MNIYESEEKEVKKQKLIEKWESAIEAAEFYGKGKEDRLIEYMRNFVDDLNKLDEPEVLSQEFIDKYKVDYDNWMPAVPIVHLQNLLVPKQELPVIPKFVAEYIDDRKEVSFPLYQAIRIVRENSRFEHSHLKEWLWTNKGQETFARAWLDGFRVEEEPKYYAKIKGHEKIYSDICFWIYDTEIEELLIDDAEIYPDVTAGYTIKATKEEWANLGINDDNADFVKVEELE